MKKTLLIALVILSTAVVGWLVYLSKQSAQREDHVPVITVMDILHASDLQAGIKQAVKQNDEAALENWLHKAEDVAQQAGLPATDMQYLRSKQAMEYVKFNARRSLFNDAFEKRFYELKGIGDLREKYPQAKDLFADAEKLLDKRDSIIQSIALTLSGAQQPTKEDIAKARQLWQERYREQTDASNDSPLNQ